MSPEKTIRWAAALFAFPFFLLLGEYILEAASGHTPQISNLAITTVVLALPACLVAFSSRVAAAISLIFWCVLLIAVLPSPIRALMGGQVHLLAPCIPQKAGGARFERSAGVPPATGAAGETPAVRKNSAHP
jgi:hypothetical protein